MPTDPSSRGPDGAELVTLRHDRLRRTAPAVQHEVNNALMVLGSNLELLGRTAAEGPPRRQLDRALEAVRRLDATVRGFLDVARRDAEDRTAIPPSDAVKQLLPLLRVVMGSRFGFELEPSANAPPVLLDRARLDLALLSLSRDAVQRMAPGSRIGARIETRDDGAVALVLALPQGAAPQGETALLVSDAACATGGRLEPIEGGVALVWPRA